MAKPIDSGSGWQVVSSDREWQKCKFGWQETWLRNRETGTIVDKTGDSLPHYPALVSFMVADNRLRVSVVYPDDARLLLQAAGYVPPPPAPPAPPADFGHADQGRPGDAQAEFNRGVTANLMTLVSALIEADIIDEATYERRFTSHLSVVDNWEAADRATRQRIRQAIPGTNTTLPASEDQV